MARTDGKVIAWSSKVFCAAARAAMPAGSRTGDVDIPEDSATPAAEAPATDTAAEGSPSEGTTGADPA